MSRTLPTRSTRRAQRSAAADEPGRVDDRRPTRRPAASAFGITARAFPGAVSRSNSPRSARAESAAARRAASAASADWPVSAIARRSSFARGRRARAWFPSCAGIAGGCRRLCDQPTSKAAWPRSSRTPSPCAGSMLDGYPERFFEVELRGVTRHRHDRLLSPPAIAEYLGQMAPAALRSRPSRSRAEITATLGPHVDLGNLHLTISGIDGPIYRPHRDRFEIGDDVYDAFTVSSPRNRRRRWRTSPPSAGCSITDIPAPSRRKPASRVCASGRQCAGRRQATFSKTFFRSRGSTRGRSARSMSSIRALCQTAVATISSRMSTSTIPEPSRADRAGYRAALPHELDPSEMAAGIRAAPHGCPREARHFEPGDARGARSASRWPEQCAAGSPR